MKVLVDNVVPELTDADIISKSPSFKPSNGDDNDNAHRINKADDTSGKDGFVRVDLTGNNDVEVGYQYKLEINSFSGNSSIPKVTLTAEHIKDGFVDLPIKSEYFAKESQTISGSSNQPHSEHAFVRVTDLAGNQSNTTSFNISKDITAPNAADLTDTNGKTEPIIYNIASAGKVTLRADLGDTSKIKDEAGIKSIETISQTDEIRLYQKVASAEDSTFAQVATRKLTEADITAGKFDFQIDAPTSDEKYEYRTKLFDEHGNESAAYGGKIDIIVDKTAPGVPTIAVSKGLIDAADAEVTLTVTLPAGTQANEKIELFTMSGNNATPIANHSGIGTGGKAHTVTGTEATLTRPL